MSGLVMRLWQCFAATVLIWVAWPVLAHDIYGNEGFLTGLVHPFLGMDHLLSIFAVGLIGMQLGGQARYSVPLAFLGFLLFGAVIGLLKVPMPLVEDGIALSVVVFGLALLFARDVPLSFAHAFVGIFALFHGHAHGAEIPALANPVWYSMGFVLSSISIMIFGVAVAWYLSLIETDKPLMRGLGGIIASLGVLIWWL